MREEGYYWVRYGVPQVGKWDDVYEWEIAYFNNTWVRMNKDGSYYDDHFVEIDEKRIVRTVNPVKAAKNENPLP
jgi:hypothetical protein